MNTRRLVLHLIVGLLTFLLGLTAAVALGGFDPLARLTQRSYSQQYTIPPQSLLDTSRSYETYGGCRKARARTAELRYRVDPLAPPAPPSVAPAAPVLPPFDEDDAPPPPPRAPRPRH
jgi:hypothetical protein